MFNIKKLVIKTAIFVLNIMYLPFKCFKTKNKITYLSRQSNSISLDFMLLKQEIEKKHPTVKQVVLTKKIEKGFIQKFKYAIHIFEQMYHIATSKVVIVDTYVIPVSVLKHKKELKVIQIWHALGAIKKFGYQVLDKAEGSSSLIAKAMKMHNNYDIVTCSSKVTAAFYKKAFNVDMKKIKVVGMPRVDYILGDNRNEEILKLNPSFNGKPTILYIPTFRKNGVVDLTGLLQNIDDEKYNLVIKLHPLDTTLVDEKYLAKGEFSTYDLMKFADYIITDYSAVAIEASLLQKPLFLYVYDIAEYSETRGLNINLTEELKSSTFEKIEDILKIIENGNYDFNSLRMFRNKYVETYNQNNTKNVCKLITKCLK